MTDIKSIFADAPLSDKEKQENVATELKQDGLDPTDRDAKELIILKQIRKALTKKRQKEKDKKFAQEHPGIAKLKDRFKDKLPPRDERPPLEKFKPKPEKQPINITLKKSEPVEPPKPAEPPKPVEPPKPTPTPKPQQPTAPILTKAKSIPIKPASETTQIIITGYDGLW
jgi:hypothetical protein